MRAELNIDHFALTVRGGGKESVEGDSFIHVGGVRGGVDDRDGRPRHLAKVGGAEVVMLFLKLNLEKKDLGIWRERVRAAITLSHGYSRGEEQD